MMFFACLFVVLAVGVRMGYSYAEACRYKRWHLTLHAIEERLDHGELEPFTAYAVFATVTEHQKLPVRMLVGMTLPCQEAKE
jgi:hypothetical protein